MLRLGAREPDRRCHDCGGSLGAGEGWIVPLDYPTLDRLLADLDKVPICDRCMVARCVHVVTVRRVSKCSDT